MTLMESHGLANRPGEPYPATFRMFQWTHWESNPAIDAKETGQPAELVSSHWTMSPLVERRGIPARRDCLGANQASSRWTNAPFLSLKEVRPGIEPGPRPYHGRVRPKHLQTNQ